MSTPLLTEDKCSTNTDDDQEACDTEVDRITIKKAPSQATTVVMSPERHDSTATVDYSTQCDPDQPTLAVPAGIMYMKNTAAFQNTNNYFIPDGSDRRIHDLDNKLFHAGILENGHSAYLVELSNLKLMLCSSQYLMEEVTGQFYAICGNSYQCMCTIPRLLQTWEPGQLIDELPVTRCTFGKMEPTGPAPAAPPTQPLLANQVNAIPNEDRIPDLTVQKPPPRNIPFHPLSFSLDTPTRHLTMEERIGVYHNYISAVSNLEHKKDLSNKLKQSEPHNIPI